MKKILITYGLYGSGHKSVANYIANYIKEHSDKYEIKVMDITDYSNLLGKLSVKLFDFVIKYRAERLFDVCYEISDNKLFTHYQDRLAKMFFDNKKLREDITNFDPDLSVNTHFYGGNIINYYNKKGWTHSKIISILTDYTPHHCWLADRKDQDAFIVANEILKNELIEYGVEAKKIYPYGIPFDKDKILGLDPVEKIYKRYKLNNRLPVYVFFGGGSSGSMAYYNYFKNLVKKRYDMNLIFICGKNDKLKRSADQLVKENNYRNVKVLGFTTDVYNILKVADCVISKPGGATVTECCEMNVPMILIPGYGGQEKYNARYVKQHGYGTKVRGYYFLGRMVNKTINHPEIIENWEKQLKKIDDSNSTQRIFKLIEKLLNKK